MKASRLAKAHYSSIDDLGWNLSLATTHALNKQFQRLESFKSYKICKYKSSNYCVVDGLVGLAQAVVIPRLYSSEAVHKRTLESRILKHPRSEHSIGGDRFHS
jgi:hypothetical protein